MNITPVPSYGSVPVPILTLAVHREVHETGDSRFETVSNEVAHYFITADEVARGFGARRLTAYEAVQLMIF